MGEGERALIAGLLAAVGIYSVGVGQPYGWLLACGCAALILLAEEIAEEEGDDDELF